MTFASWAAAVVKFAALTKAVDRLITGARNRYSPLADGSDDAPPACEQAARRAMQTSTNDAFAARRY